MFMLVADPVLDGGDVPNGMAGWIDGLLSKVSRPLSFAIAHFLKILYPSQVVLGKFLFIVAMFMVESAVKKLSSLLIVGALGEIRDTDASLQKVLCVSFQVHFAPDT